MRDNPFLTKKNKSSSSNSNTVSAVPSGGNNTPNAIYPNVGTNAVGNNLSVNQAVSSFTGSDAEVSVANAISAANSFIRRDYLGGLANKGNIIYDLPKTVKEYRYTRMLHLQRIVYDSDEAVSINLSTVYRTLSNLNKGSNTMSLFLLIVGQKTHSDVYLGVRDLSNVRSAFTALCKALEGNFPGISYTSDFESPDIEKLISSVVAGNTAANRIVSDSNMQKNVAAVSIIPSQQKMPETYVRNIEKFIDSMQGRDYTALILASPMSSKSIQQRRSGLEQLSTELSKYKSVSLQMSRQQGHSVSTSFAENFSNAVCDSINKSISTGTSTGTSSHRDSSHGTNFGLGFLGWNWGNSSGTGNFGATQNANVNGTAQSTTQSQGTTTSSGETTNEGSGITISINQTNKTISELMSRIDTQLERIEQGEAFGMWECAGYFISDSHEIANEAASNYAANVTGPGSYIESSHINRWTAVDDPDGTNAVLNSLKYLYHPNICINGDLRNPLICSPACMISGMELPMIMGLPTKSVAGLAVQEMAAFGREIRYSPGVKAPKDSCIDIGRVFHMGKETKSPVKLSLSSLSAHMFITGTPGSGKSNATFNILDQLYRENVKFMVLEPVKGEYKNVFGFRKGLTVFTAHPRKGRQLRFNPFEFNEKTLLSAHINSIYEFLCSCWPLYGPQPALLKEAIEMSYQQLGWDIRNSCQYGPRRFPTFETLLANVLKRIDQAGFSEKSRNDVTGTLVAKVSSLTGGSVGSILNSKVSLTEEELFDSSVIVDLTDVGGAGDNEHQKIIMGTMMIRMLEYLKFARLTSKLRHITIIEEAHNILSPNNTGHTSIEDTNVSGKFSEMMSSAIAELRGYGEGFIIIDQSPSKVDKSAISHTNTKLILNLPSEDDRLVASGSFSASPEQADEIARLPVGIAVVKQMGWIEPVLVKIPEYRYVTREFPEDTAVAICKLKGMLASELVKQFIAQKLNRRKLLDVVASASVSESKKADYYSLINIFMDRYLSISKSPKHKPGDPNITYGELFTSALSCEEIFQRLPVPVGKDKSDYKQRCLAWQQSAAEQLSYYYDPSCISVIDFDKIAVKLLVLSECSENYDARNLYSTLYVTKEG